MYKHVIYFDKHVFFLLLNPKSPAVLSLMNFRTCLSPCGVTVCYAFYLRCFIALIYHCIILLRNRNDVQLPSGIAYISNSKLHFSSPVLAWTRCFKNICDATSSSAGTQNKKQVSNCSFSYMGLGQCERRKPFKLETCEEQDEENNLLRHRWFGQTVIKQQNRQQKKMYTWMRRGIKREWNQDAGNEERGGRWTTKCQACGFDYSLRKRELNF